MKVAMFVRNDLTVDARVLKEAATLRGAGHEVTIVGTTRPGTPHVVEREQRDGFLIVRVPMPRWRRWWRWVRLPSRVWSIARRRHARPGERMDALDWLAMWRFGTLPWARAAAREAGAADVYHGHDLTGLPAAVFGRRAHGGRLVYDSHELYLESPATLGRPSWAIARLDRWERAWTAEADALVTVNQAIADILAERLRPRRVVVVHNCPPRRTEPIDGADWIRRAASIPSDAPVVVSHGGFRPGRGMERLAEAMLEPPIARAHLALLGFGPLRDDLLALAAEPRFGGRVHVLDRVAPDEVVDWVASADLEAVPFRRTPRNHYVSTPNKLFESLAAGVPVVMSDAPGVRAVVMDDPDGPLGAMCDPDDTADIARAIASILDLPPDARSDLRERCRQAARERWNWETESARLVELYHDLEAAG